MQNIKRNIAILLLAYSVVFEASASLINFEYQVGGFTNGGSVTGTFSGRDINGDGYISSFLFSQDIDFTAANTPAQLAPGLNEIVSATASFQGIFDAGDVGPFLGGDLGSVNSFSLSHDLTDMSTFLGLPDDLFFVLNYKIGSGLLGDDEFEGILVGTAEQPFVFGLGQFLPIPDGAASTQTTGSLPGGSSLTSRALLDESGGTPCINDLTCGLVHSVGFFPGTGPVLAGADFTSELANVNQVPEPAIITLMFAGLGFLFVLRLNNQSIG